MAEVKDKKDISILLESQLPEFVTYEHPQFKKFVEKYYEFLESHEIYYEGITFNEYKLIPEDTIQDAGFEFLGYEDGDRLQLESERDTAGNANLQFSIGETVTGNTSGATALVTGTKGNTHAFIKPTNEAVFLYGEQITGDTSRAYTTLANGIVDGTFPDAAIESFRSRGATAAIRELSDMQDIDKTNEGLIDDAWKKEFYTNVPRTSKTDRRQLLKRMKNVYRSKGNEQSFTWLFRALFQKEDVEFYYPRVDLMRLSDGRWTLDKTIKVVASSATNLELFTGRKIIGASSKCTAIVERAITSSVGALLVTELYLSNVIAGLDDDNILGFFKVNERIDTELDIDGNKGIAFTSGLVMSINVDVGGTEYELGDEININGGGGQDAKARVSAIADAVVEGITIKDSGDGYSVGDVLKFVDEGTGGQGAAARIGSIIKTGEVIINSDQVGTYKETLISSSDYGNQMIGHNANTHMYANTLLIFSAAIEAGTGKYFDATGPFFGTQFIKAGNQIRKQIKIDTNDRTLTQSGTTVTLSEPLTDQERRDVVGGKLTYSNANTTIITGYQSSSVLTVKDTHSIGSAQPWMIHYGSRDEDWGTIVGANSTQILYVVGSYDRDRELDNLTVNHFANNDNIIVYDAARTGAYAAKHANSADSEMTHTGITFDIGNTPANLVVNSVANTTIVDAFGQGGTSATHVHIGAWNTTTKNVGAINACTITAGGEKYEQAPLVTVTNSYISTLGNALDIMGANNALVNMNLHTYMGGTITQTGNTVTLLNGTFPEANSGLLKITYANGSEDHVTAVTNTSTLKVANEKNFGINDASQIYTLTYMAIANNFPKNSYIYNDDYSARARILDYIDEAKAVRPYVANGNTTLRLDMLTTQTFTATTEYLLMENNDIIAYEDDPADGLFLGSSRVFTEDGPTSERVTAYNGTVSTYNTGTITQSIFYFQQEDASDSSGIITEDGNDKFTSERATIITLSGGNFPNDVTRGTLTYPDSVTSMVTGFTNSTSIEVDTHKLVSANTYSLDYNPSITWGINREVTAAGSGTGNRTVTITDTGHYLRTGDKVSITGCLTTQVNGVYPITVINTNTYSYTLPEDGVATLSGEIRSRGVASAWLSSYNTFTVDTSPKGNNATVAVSAIAIGAIKAVEVYNFGAGYTSLPDVTTSTGNKNAVLSANLGAFAEYAGYYVGGKGLISGTPKIQDNKYYQDFSYVLKTDFDVTDYRDSVKRLTHPSGMLMFGEVAFRNKVSAALFDATRSGDINSTEANTGVTKLTDSPRYRLTTPTINSYANLRHQNTAALVGGGYESYLDPKGGILELQTAPHSWQAMDGKVDVRGDENLLYEDFRDVTMQRTSAEGSIIFATITETFHNIEVGDKVQITRAVEDYWNGSYIVKTVPNGNSYTVQLYKGDPGDSVSATAQTATGTYSGGYLKVETLSFANGFRANTSNFDAPFNNAPLDELDGELFLLERGGSFLYPKLKFPTQETGTVSINMSFNNDLLMEDHGYETGLSDSGYILTEDSGGIGLGPARYIRLEQDTEGIEWSHERGALGHERQSAPYMETKAIITLLDSMRTGIQTEDGYDLVAEDADTGSGLPASKLITEQFAVIRNVSFPGFVVYIDTLSSLGKITTEDNCMILHENGYDYIRNETDYSLKSANTELEFNLYQKVGYSLIMEDGSHIIEEGDETTSKLVRFETEETHVKTSEPSREIEFDLVEQMGWHLMMEDGITHHIFEDDTRALTEENSLKSSTRMMQYIDHMTSLGKILTEDDCILLHENGTDYIRNEIDYNCSAVKPELEWELYENTNYNLILEDGSHLIEEGDNSGSLSRFNIEESHAKSPTNVVTTENVGELLILEDNSGYMTTESNTPERIQLVRATQGIRSGQSNITDRSQLSGRIEFVHNNTTVAGFDTLFSTELSIGDVIQINDENVLLEGDEFTDQILMETDERLEHEGLIIEHVQNDDITPVSGVQIKDFRWFISHEDNPKPFFNVQEGQLFGLQGSYSVDSNVEGYYLLGEDTNADNFVSLEAETGTVELETPDWQTNDLLLETEDKLLLNEPGEFKVASITDDDTLVVTRKHWGGTESSMPFFKQGTETEVTASVSYS